MSAIVCLTCSALTRPSARYIARAASTRPANSSPAPSTLLPSLAASSSAGAVARRCSAASTARAKAARSRSRGRRSARTKTAALTVGDPSACATAAGVRRSTSTRARPSGTRGKAFESWPISGSASASATRSGRYSGDVAGPAIASVNVCSRRMTPSMASGRPVLTAWRRIPGPPRDRVKARLLRLYRALLAHHGPQRWWPARTPFEVAVGAILVQHTAWAGAAGAIAALRAAGRLTPARLAALDAATLGALVRPAGTWRLKARRLLDFTRWLLDRF